MGILTGLLILIIAYAVYHFYPILKTGRLSPEKASSRLKHIRAIGLFALITGVLGQLIGLYTAFSVIERAADISPAMMFGGLKISMITTLYGMLIYLFSILLWFLLDLFLIKKT